MSFQTIVFYVLALMVVGGGILAVTSLKIFRSAVYLLLSLLGIAGLYFYMAFEFMAAVQIVVYVGGIVVLIIFSIFLTSESGSDMKRPAWLRLIFSGLAALFGALFTIQTVLKHGFIGDTGAELQADVRTIGRQMLSVTEHGYILSFEVVSVLLLAAMIGCIVIAIKVKPAS